MIRLHNLGTIGGSWLQDETKLVALLGSDSNPVAVKIKDSSIKDIKPKVPKVEEIQDAIMENISFKNIKGVREIFHYKNIIPVPHALIKSFLSLKQHDPINVAKAFNTVMTNNEKELILSPEDTENPTSPGNENRHEDSSQVDDSTLTIENDAIAPIRGVRHQPESEELSHQQEATHLWLEEFQHALYFCYLCEIGKMDPIIYSVQPSNDIIEWQRSVESKYLFNDHLHNQNMSNILASSGRSESIDNDDIMVESSISLKECHMMHTLLKISENLDQNTLRLARDSEEKAKGFAKLENHKRLLILNATEDNPEENSSPAPTDFCRAFLLKSTVYRAREALIQGLKSN
jgi:hypothetical protein